VAYSEAYSPTIAQGLVIQTDPPAGSTVARDSTVTVQVSLGKEPVTIPATIVGKSINDATAVLTGLGLSVSGVQGNPSKPVTGSSPAVGTQVKPGSAVTLTTN
jgi:beta-lactam-binding protein with PASTA domain